MYGEFLYALMVAFVVVTGYTYVKNRSSANSSQQLATPEYIAFRNKFVAIYLIMMAADWMQGPYVYRLYSYYGFSREDNGVLFIAGFGSSLVFGTWAGPMADRYGRKLNCIMYGVAYFLSCMTKHVNHFGVLMVGRLLGGFATSILWSAFESWMVSEHNARGFAPELISQTFSMMFTGNGLVSIVSGFIAQWAVDAVDHPVAPFDVSALFLVIGSIIIFFSWKENYGNQNASSSVGQQMTEAIALIQKDKRVALVGLQQAAFEGAMYTFVFMWTPTLEQPEKPIPHGLIFAAFMIACSLGGTIFGFLASRVAIVQIMRTVFLLSAAAMAVPVVASEARPLIMGGFIVFEICVGMFWPSIGTLRAEYVPESHRATIINLFRAPLNLVVCCVLYFQGDMNVGMVFVFCVAFHFVAFVLCVMLTRLPAVEREEGQELRGVPTGGH